MRRAARAVFIVVMALTVTSPVTSAAPVASVVSGTITGTFEGTGVYETLGPVCPIIHEVFTGTYEPDRPQDRNGTYEVDVCIDNPNENFEWPLSGTFEIVTGQGYRLLGTATGVAIPNDISGPILVTLTVTDSPGSPRPVRGTITIDGITDQSYPAPVGTSVESGTFSADLHR
jgi:hypothetical protein